MDPPGLPFSSTSCSSCNGCRDVADVDRFQGCPDQQFSGGTPMELLLCPGSANVCRLRMCAGRQRQTNNGCCKKQQHKCIFRLAFHWSVVRSRLPSAQPLLHCVPGCSCVLTSFHPIRHAKPALQRSAFFNRNHERFFSPPIHCGSGVSVPAQAESPLHQTARLLVCGGVFVAHCCVQRVL